jgi:hypothetical protein
MASTDARPVPIKNTALRVTFPIFDADGDFVSGASALDSEVSIDGAAFADCTNEATEIGTSGIYYLDLTSGEMNGDTIAVQVKTSTSGAKTAPIIMYPQESGDIKVDIQSAAGTAWASGAITASAIAADAITAAKIADGAIDAATFAAGAINAAAIAADAITDAKVAADVTIASVTGAVGSVTAGVTVTTNNDKTGYGLSAAAIQAIWDALTAALTTVGSVGKLLVDNLNATVSSRLASASISLAAGAVTVGTNNDKTGYSIAAGGIGNGAHAAAELNAIADAILDRNMATGTDTGADNTTTRTVRQALRRLRNREAIAAGTGTVYKEDDATASWTYAATTAAGNPLSEVNPT